MTDFITELLSRCLIFLNPVLIVSSFDFSRLSNFVEKLITKIYYSLDEGGVSLDGGRGCDLGEEVKDLVPGLSLEGSLGMFAEVS